MEESAKKLSQYSERYRRPLEELRKGEELLSTHRESLHILKVKEAKHTSLSIPVSLLHEIHDKEEQISCLDKKLSLLRIEERLLILLAEADLARRNGDLDYTIQNLKEAIPEYQRRNFKDIDHDNLQERNQGLNELYEELAKVYFERSQSYEQRSMWDDAIADYRESLAYYQKAGRMDLKDIYYTMGACYEKWAGETDDHILKSERLDHAIENYFRAGDDCSQARIYRNKASILQSLEKYREAVSCLLNAIRCSKNADDFEGTIIGYERMVPIYRCIPGDNTRQIAQTYLDSGRDYRYFGRSEKATEAFRKALDLSIREECIDIQAETLLELSKLQKELYNILDALGSCSRSYEIFSRLNKTEKTKEAKSIIIHISIEIVKILDRDIRRFRLCKDLDYTEAINILRKIYNIGLKYENLEDLDKAIIIYNRCLELFDSLKETQKRESRGLERDILNSLARVSS